MKYFISITAFIAFIAVCYFALKPTPSNELAKDLALPWQIEQLADGGTQVFGVRPGTTTVADSLRILGEDHDLAIIIDRNDVAGLEIYFSHFKAGPLAGKLILSVKAEKAQLEEMATHANKSSYMASGSRKFELNREDLSNIQSLPVNGISFLPGASLSREIIEQRFGRADEEISLGESLYFLYPAVGLSISLNEQAKEVLQYVHPKDFDSMRAPLVRTSAETH